MNNPQKAQTASSGHGRSTEDLDRVFGSQRTVSSDLDRIFWSQKIQKWSSGPRISRHGLLAIKNPPNVFWPYQIKHKTYRWSTGHRRSGENLQTYKGLRFSGFRSHGEGLENIKELQNKIHRQQKAYKWSSDYKKSLEGILCEDLLRVFGRFRKIPLYGLLSLEVFGLQRSREISLTRKEKLQITLQRTLNLQEHLKKVFNKFSIYCKSSAF